MAVKLISYKMDRRDLFRLTAIGAGGLYLANLEAFAADSHCEILTGSSTSTSGHGIEQFIKDPGADRKKLFFFIDGCYTSHFIQDASGDNAKINGIAVSDSGADVPLHELSSTQINSFRILTKARVSIHCEFEQKPGSFVETVILSDENHKILATARFTSANFIKKGEMRIAPYVVFDRLNLKEGKPLHITYVIREDNAAQIFQYRIDGKDAGPSRLDFAHLPSEARAQLSQSFLSSLLGGNPDGSQLSNRGSHSYWIDGSDTTSRDGKIAAIPAFPFNGSGGYIANAYYNQRPVPQHSVRACFHEVGGDGSFKVEVEKMHGDISIAHFMRYFLVLDPVGRILGGLRRRFEGSDLTQYDAVTGNKNGKSFMIHSGLMEGSGDDDFKLASYTLKDMPYVQIITEDVLDAIGKISLRIR